VIVGGGRINFLRIGWRYRRVGRLPAHAEDLSRRSDPPFVAEALTPVAAGSLGIVQRVRFIVGGADANVGIDDRFGQRGKEWLVCSRVGRR
jgi:hypothetical protein